MTIAAFFLALAFVSNIANRLYSKHTLNKLDIYSVTIISNAVCAAVLFPFFLLYGSKEYTLENTSLILLLGILWTIAAWVMNASIAMNDFSFKEIIRQTRVLWVVLGGIFLLGESLALYDGVGIMLIIVSVYIISYKRFTWREHVSSKPLLLAWFSSFLIAAITLLEKTLLVQIDVIDYAFFAFLLPSVFLLIFLNMQRQKDCKLILTEHKRELIIFSGLMLIVYYCSIAAYKMLPISVAYPIIQSSSVIAILLGTWFFEKNHHVVRKTVAAVIGIIGIVLIQLF